LWIPVLFGVGILVYFKIPFEPDIKISILVPSLLIVGAVSLKKIKIIFWTLIILLILSCGFLSAKIRAMSVQAPVLNQEIGVKKIQGVIENIETRTHGKRFILTDLKIA
jgi:competence protein ComEC